MADISELIKIIESSVRGEAVRDAVIEAINFLNDHDSNAYFLNGHSADFFAKQSDLEEITPLATEALPDSSMGITSGAVYTLVASIMTAIDKIAGEEDAGGEDANITDKLLYINNIKKNLRNILISKQVAVPTDTPLKDYVDKISEIPVTAEVSVSSLTINETGAGEYTYEANPGSAYNPITAIFKAKTMSKTINTLGTYNAADENPPMDGYSSVSVSISGLEGEGGPGGVRELKLITKSVGAEELRTSKTFHASDERAIGYSSFTVNTDGLVGEKVIDVPSQAGYEKTVEASSDGLLGFNKVTIQVSVKEGPFTVRFMQGKTVLSTVTVENRGGSAEYVGVEPSYPGMYFTGWDPPPMNIVEDTDCQAKFVADLPNFDDQISDGWDKILESNGENYAIGQWKSVAYKSFTLPKGTRVEGGIVNLTKAAGPWGSTRSTWIMRNIPLKYIGANDPRIIESNVTFNKQNNLITKGYTDFSHTDAYTVLNGVFLDAIAATNSDPTRYLYSHLVAAKAQAVNRPTAIYDSETKTIWPGTINGKLLPPSVYECTGGSVGSANNPFHEGGQRLYQMNTSTNRAELINSLIGSTRTVQSMASYNDVPYELAFTPSGNLTPKISGPYRGGTGDLKDDSLQYTVALISF